METLNIEILPRARADAEFIRAFKAARAGKKTTPKEGVYFISLEAVRALLSAKRMALLHSIREHQPKSINALTKIAGRDFKNVYADVMLLKRYGLVQMSATAGKLGREISVPYRAIHIHSLV
ncbi:MAG: hypothetical protein HY922_05345 [Elusimicrobia bacterium]|nr:hypothetical protein [Elusimicrobiota bacterium]